MSVLSSDFLSCAEVLARDGQHEIDWRNAGSRAYYASWHCTSAVDEAIYPHAGMQIDVGVHEKRIQKFSNYPLGRNNPNELDSSTARSIRAVGYMLSTLRSNRVLADYKINEQYDQAQAITNVEGAKRLAKKIEDLQVILTKASTEGL